MVWFDDRRHISCLYLHLLSKVVPLEEHTGSSNDGQLGSHIHCGSNGPKALQVPWKSHVTLMQGSRSETQPMQNNNNDKYFFFTNTVFI